MENDAEAESAINALNGQEWNGRKLVVNEARPMEARPPRQGGGFKRNYNDRGYNDR
jgi:RNA recognition motif-containing protein